MPAKQDEQRIEISAEAKHQIELELCQFQQMLAAAMGGIVVAMAAKICDEILAKPGRPK